MKLLVRADDLGYSEAVNYGIEKSVREGIVNNVGVMVNMPSTEHGLTLLGDVEVCYGCHTNICIGKPLTDPALIPSITKPNGHFKPSHEYRNAKEDFVILEEVLLEIEAQYHSFVQKVGRKPQYFEGHAIKSPTFQKGLKIIADKYDLKYSGMPMGNEPLMVNRTKVYFWMESMQAEYDPFKTLQKIISHPHSDGVDMLILHPGYLDAFILENSSLTTPRALEVAMAIDSQTWSLLKSHNITLLTYDDL